VVGPGRCLTINFLGACVTNPIKEFVLYYFACPKCGHVSSYASHNDWLVCGYRRCGVRFLRFGTTMDEWEYRKVWG